MPYRFSLSEQHRRGKMDISSFLAVIIFYCLLFMEPDPAAQKAYNKLGLDLGDMYKSLRKLQKNICTQNIANKVVDGRINTIISEVKSARESLGRKDEKVVRKDISIAGLVKNMKKDIAVFSPSINYSSGELDALLNGIENVWKNKIKMTFDEAMK
jgi:predicted RNase H-like nuclease (RuvC/YqgF family)